MKFDCSGDGNRVCSGGNGKSLQTDDKYDGDATGAAGGVAGVNRW